MATPPRRRGRRPEPETAPEPQAEPEPEAHGVYHFLDVGGTKYGECILVEFGATRILIDGSHQHDFKGQRGYDSIPEQLAQILGDGPHALDLIVVTHCHADHVGCLPELVATDVIRPRFALLTDPKLGFGRPSDHDATAIDAASPAERLAALLREEDATDLNDAELEAFADAAATVETRYNAFVADLAERGVEVVRYLGQPLGDELAALLGSSGATLFGPSEVQLLRCAQQIETTNKEAEDAAADLASDSPQAIVALYRSLAAEDFGDSRNPRGNGMNCQSITFAFGPPGARVLLAGDMQFADPGVADMDREIAKLREAVIAGGPYRLFKTTHHTSHNGQDDSLLDALGSPTLIVHSGGLRDEDHPYPGMLKTLERREGVVFARTDRNGRITASPHLADDQALAVAKGKLNDFSPNILPDDPDAEIKPMPQRQVSLAPRGEGGGGVRVVIVDLPPGPADLTVAGVDIVVHAAGGVTELTPEREPRSRRAAKRVPAQPKPGDGALPQVAPGRSIADLMFVTDPIRLRANVGQLEADGVLAALQAGGAHVVCGEADTLVDRAHKAIDRDNHPSGIVLLGGYDVVPPVRRDVLTRDLRQRLGKLVASDADQFWVWTDSRYGDLDDDGLAELPLSRVPDGRDSSLFVGALAAKPLALQERFGVHNIARPFAANIWQDVAGASGINVSEAFGPDDVPALAAQASSHYLMLHGRHTDATFFEGEYAGQSGYPRAFDLRSVPTHFDGVVFSGCCWGALIVRGRAVDHVGALPLPRMVEESIALSYLKAGALAFVGCTGAHYSGTSIDPDENLAARLHEAFWKALPQAGGSPARALFQAKRVFARLIVAAGEQLDPLSTARRLKNLQQFTCLGLGW